MYNDLICQNMISKQVHQQISPVWSTFIAKFLSNKHVLKNKFKFEKQLLKNIIKVQKNVSL